ncbi:MAG: hypothetical protein ABIC91_02735 [Nanoarchaeota archaeon]|nr:hypothetical protein [Nanoarchaeota archaeon]MBU1030505.1 hypothetical protein [Nanoarchaeota archaeon]MBU1850483.1 hypothetical protein [Nanoarchaeota archaeon]
MLISKTLKFYKREDIRNAIISFAKNKEIAVRYRNKGFGKRPDVLIYSNDVLEHAKRGASSFHCSEELWKNPMQITKNSIAKDLTELRIGWDLVLDIDCHFFEYSKLAAYYTIKALEHHGIKSITCKYSGNKGFHIAVPFEAFPESVNGQDIKELFPEAPRRIATYIKYLIKEPVSKAIIKLEKGSFNAVIRKTGKKSEEITRYEEVEFGDKIPKLDAEPFLDIDTILISQRHLYRMPYSLHEKSGLVSIPIKKEDVLKFRKEDAEPDFVVPKNSFLDRNVSGKEATKLLVQAFDFEINDELVEDDQERSYKKEYDELTSAISEDLFPPCIKKILEGLEDGKKRAVFILSNFLLSVGWSIEEIEKRLLEWNKKNSEPLRETILKGQLRYRKLQKDKMPPPNCNNLAYYKAFGVCKPEPLCQKIKNPIQYSKIKVLKNKTFNKKKRKNKTEDL